MPRSRTANRRRKTISKVSRKPKSRATPRCERFQNSALDYNSKISQFANYAQLGLLADANQIGASREHITGFKPRVKAGGTAPAAAGAQVGPPQPHPLELEVPEALKVVKKVPLGERQVLLKLEEQYGDDYGAMARDMRLNSLQHTAAHLRRRIQKMHEEDAEEAEEATASVAAGNAPPPPRLRAKVTRNPNPAFRKGSRNFT